MTFKTNFLIFAVLWCSFLSTNAFVTKSGQDARVVRPSDPSAGPLSSSALSERRWNFNEGQSPWGMKKNAEIWNGRVAQMAFTWIFLQELVTGKGVIKGIDEGNLFFLFNYGLFGVCLVGLTGWLALKGEDDYTLQ